MSSTINYNDFFNEEVGEPKYFGNAGAGAILIAKDTGRILLAHRSEDVNEPHTWGVWGGKIDVGEAPKEAVAREVEEETGYDGISRISPLYTYRDGDFKYYNFLIIVPFEFTPQLNWESDGSVWVEFGKWPNPMHFGLQTLIQQAGDKIKRVIDLVKKKRTLNEVKSPDIVVGFIDPEFNIISSNNTETHMDLLYRHPQWREKAWKSHHFKNWRFNSRTNTVYWYSRPTEDEKEEVKDHIITKYKGFKVLYHVYIGERWSDEYSKLQMKAHGLTEIDDVPAIVKSSHTFSNEFINYIKMVENDGKVGFKNGKWYPHSSSEGGLPTIGYGHKIKNKDDLNRFRRGISDATVERILISDLEHAKRTVYSDLKKMFEVQIYLDTKQEEILTDYAFNLGTIRTFPLFVRAILDKDWNTAAKEHKRFVRGKELGRNKVFFNRYLRTENVKTSSKISIDREGMIDVGTYGYKWRTPYSYLSFGEEPASMVAHLYMIQTPKEEDRNKGHSKELLDLFFQMLKRKGWALDVGSYTTSGMSWTEHVIERMAKQYNIRLI
jgi:8-oxo-dGTP pyrophosphatase MutT (NUDIX family)/GH24 family phage-related lysozyme (muramidase)